MDLFTRVVPPVCTIQVKVSSEVLLREKGLFGVFDGFWGGKWVNWGWLMRVDHLSLCDDNVIFLPDESSCPPHSAFCSLQP